MRKRKKKKRKGEWKRTVERSKEEDVEKSEGTEEIKER